MCVVGHFHTVVYKEESRAGKEGVDRFNVSLSESTDVIRESWNPSSFVPPGIESFQTLATVLSSIYIIKFFVLNSF